MSVHPTNTLIITGLPAATLDDTEYIKALQQEIISTLGSKNDVIQFIILKSFRRIVIIFNEQESSERIHDFFKAKHQDFKIGYSLNNYTDNANDNYLQLPNNSRMFLISPPASPPIDFDYDRTEEEPNKLQIYTHEELHDILMETQKSLSDMVKKNQKETKYSNNSNVKSLIDFEKEIILNDSNSDSKPKIILNPINGENDHLIGKAIEKFRTSLPPRSVFDDIDDESEDDEQ